MATWWRSKELWALVLAKLGQIFFELQFALKEGPNNSFPVSALRPEKLFLPQKTN